MCTNYSFGHFSTYISHITTEIKGTWTTHFVTFSNSYSQEWPPASPAYTAVCSTVPGLRDAGFALPALLVLLTWVLKTEYFTLMLVRAHFNIRSSLSQSKCSFMNTLTQLAMFSNVLLNLVFYNSSLRWRKQEHAKENQMKVKLLDVVECPWFIALRSEIL